MKPGAAGVTSYKCNVVENTVDLFLSSFFVGRRAGWSYDYILHDTLLCVAECKSVLLISKDRYLEVQRRVVVSVMVFWS